MDGKSKKKVVKEEGIDKDNKDENNVLNIVADYLFHMTENKDNRFLSLFTQGRIVIHFRTHAQLKLQNWTLKNLKY